MAKKQIKQTKFMFAQVKGFEGDELIAVASTGALDRDNEIIDPGAWGESLDGYRANPVILATHQHRLASGSSPVIGSASTIDATEKGLIFKMKFAGTALGREYEQLYREGHMRAFSVGFIPIDGKWEDLNRGALDTAAGGKAAEAAKRPPAERGSPSQGLKRVWHITKAELLEISAVPVPANPEALAAMRAAGAMGAADEGLATTIAAEIMLAMAEFDLAGKLADRLTATGTGALSDRLEQIENRQALILDRLSELAEAISLSSDTLGAFASPPLRAPAGGDGGSKHGDSEGQDAIKRAAAKLKAATKT